MHASRAMYSLDKAGKLAATPDAELAGVFPSPGRGFAAGGAGLFSTAGDYARFGQMLLNGGELDGVRVLGRKTVELMMVNHLAHLARPTIQGSESDGFGLGGSVRIDLAKGNRLGSVGQFGWTGAATTYFNIDPLERTMVLLDYAAPSLQRRRSARAVLDAVLSGVGRMRIAAFRAPANVPGARVQGFASGDPIPSPRLRGEG